MRVASHMYSVCDAGNSHGDVARPNGQALWSIAGTPTGSVARARPSATHETTAFSRRPLTRSGFVP